MIYKRSCRNNQRLSRELFEDIPSAKALLLLVCPANDSLPVRYHYFVDREFPFWRLIKYIAEDEKVLQTPDLIRSLDYCCVRQVR